MMNVNLHTDGAKAFYAQGYAYVRDITKDVYNVLQIGIQTDEGHNNIFLYASIEQLEQIKQAIDKAIEQAKKLEEEV